MSRERFQNWIDGDPQAFTHLYRSYYPQIRDFATALIGDPATGEDLAQETFVRLYRAQAQLRQEGISNGRALIYTICRRLAIQYSAHRRRWQTLAYHREEILEVLALAAESTPEELLAAAEVRISVHRAIDVLPEPQREAILLRHMEDLSYREISGVLQCSISQVRARLHYARKLLRGQLKRMNIRPSYASAQKQEDILKILIAEDDAVTRPQLEGLLTKWGHEVVACSDGLQAWEAVQQDDAPRLILLDWAMPGMDGIELCRRIRTLPNSGQYYILFLTIKARDEDVAEGMEAGADAYMTKPLAREDLQAQIHTGVQEVELRAG